MGEFGYYKQDPDETNIKELVDSRHTVSVSKMVNNTIILPGTCKVVQVIQEDDPVGGIYISIRFFTLEIGTRIFGRYLY